MKRKPSDFNARLRYTLPKLNSGSYSSLMKLLENSLGFDVSDPAKFRLKVLDHYYKYGWKSTVDAFGVGKSTLYDWRKVFEQSKKSINSLVPQSTRPKSLRVMTTDPRVLEFIKSFRSQYGNVGKNKLKIFSDAYTKELGISEVSASLIGKVIKKKNLFWYVKKNRPKRTKLLYPRVKYAPKETLPGYIEVDSVFISLLGARYYFITAIDIVTKFAWAKLTTNLSSHQAKSSLLEFMGNYHQKVRIVQTDNGHEFMGEFNDYLEEVHIKHEFIYPRSPKINGVIERFNRTIREEFVQRQETFNMSSLDQKLTNYLIWYNNVRPHQSLNYMTPTAFLNNLKAIPECV